MDIDILHVPANTKHSNNICTMLDQRRRRWADVVQMLYKCFEFAGVCGGIVDGYRHSKLVESEWMAIDILNVCGPSGWIY